MRAGFDRIGLGRFAGQGERLARTATVVSATFGRSLLWLLAVFVLACGIWMLLSTGSSALGQPVNPALASVESPPQADAAATTSAPSGAQAPAMAELDRLRISSQTWRRGGLGSRALVTLTLRNDNDYAVKDVEIICAFSRRDGSHLTDRSRVLGDIVSMKSRKTFARVPVGVVNVNADQAKCSLVAARRE
ncbi:hypothetical protein [Bradyrhizobium sp.]|uniref:hypothetical protein n=1 Tax=Bradyrhizobium sp. TaxID=376 RepID=UPI0039E229BC